MTPGHGAVAGRPGRLLLSVDRNQIGVGPVGPAQPSCPGSHAGAPRRRRPLREEGRCFSSLALRWLIVQLRTERLNRLIVDTDPSGPGAADVAVGRTDLPAPPTGPAHPGGRNPSEPRYCSVGLTTSSRSPANVTSRAAACYAALRRGHYPFLP